MAFNTYFEEHEDSPVENGDRKGAFSFQRIFLTAWGDRWSFLRELFTGGTFGFPCQYSTEWPWVLADTFQVQRLVNKPETAAFSDPRYSQLTHDTIAKITVTYSPLQADQQQDQNQQQLPDGTWATYSQQSNIEFRSLTNRSCYWESNGDPLPADVTPVVPDTLTTHTVEWQQVRTVPWITLGNMKGKVNATAFRLPGSPQIFAPETLLFEGLDDSVTLSFDGENTRALTLRFTEKAQSAFTTNTVGGAGTGTVYGWNHQFRDDTREYDRPVSDTATPMFQTYEFNNLWTAAS